MKSVKNDPGSASTEDLAEYWRMSSVRATRELAGALGLQRIKGRFPWYSIWATEGLAPPRRNRWEDLKLPHSTAADVAEVPGESARSGRRRGVSKPDPSSQTRSRSGKSRCGGEQRSCAHGRRVRTMRDSGLRCAHLFLQQFPLLALLYHQRAHLAGVDEQHLTVPVA